MSDEALLERTRSAPDLFPALQSALNEVVGHRLFTLLAIDHERHEAARIYTSHPVDYPIGGRKPLGDMTYWGQIVIEARQPWIGRSAVDIERAFFDHALIAALGCASCLNVPVVDHDAAGGPLVVGTINLLHEAEWYVPAHVAQVMPFAGLLVQPFRSWAAAVV